MASRYCELLLFSTEAVSRKRRAAGRGVCGYRLEEPSVEGVSADRPIWKEWEGGRGAGWESCWICDCEAIQYVSPFCHVDIIHDILTLSRMLENGEESLDWPIKWTWERLAIHWMLNALETESNISGPQTGSTLTACVILGWLGRLPAISARPRRHDRTTRGSRIAGRVSGQPGKVTDIGNAFTAD